MISLRGKARQDRLSRRIAAARLEDASVLHGGEAAPARNRFLALSEADRAALLAHLDAL
jgi:CxxC motif-containing protein (DUF1111 family)